MFPRGAGPLLRRRAALCIRPSAPAEYHIQRLEAGEFPVRVRQPPVGAKADRLRPEPVLQAEGGDAQLSGHTILRGARGAGGKL